MAQALRPGVLLVGLLLLVGCADRMAQPPVQAAAPAPSVEAAACPPGLERMRTAQLLLGRNRAGREVVSDGAWLRFLGEEVTPRFPDGLTVVDAAGQWRGVSGRVERERSKLLLLVLPSGDAKAAELGQVINAYKTRFGQESVGRVETEVCAGF